MFKQFDDDIIQHNILPLKFLQGMIRGKSHGWGASPRNIRTQFHTKIPRKIPRGIFKIPPAEQGLKEKENKWMKHAHTVPR